MTKWSIDQKKSRTCSRVPNKNNNDEDVSIDDGFSPNDDGHAVVLRLSNVRFIIIICQWNIMSSDLGNQR